MPAANLSLIVGNRQFLVGCTRGLDEKTALIDIQVTGSVTFSAAADATLRAAALELCPEQPLFRVTETDWPTAFLKKSPDAHQSGMQWLGDWIIALTVAIQRWGRDPVWRGRIAHAGPDQLRLAIPWNRDYFCSEALDLAAQMVHRCLATEWDPATEPLRLSNHFGERWPGLQADGLAVNSFRFVEAAVARDIPFDVLPSFVQLGWGCNAERFDMAFTGRTSWMASTIAHNKWKTKLFLANESVPVPRGWLVDDADQALNAVVSDMGWPVVIKPSNQELGQGVVVGISDEAALRRVFDRAASYSGGVLVEQQIEGDDHRLLVVNGRFVAGARRSPAAVTGDGVHTVNHLVDEVNADKRRGTQRYSLLKKLLLDDEALECLAAQGLGADSVPDAGRRVTLRRIANISNGGTSEEITDTVHPDNRMLAERVARIVGLDIAGIDFISPDISRSWRDVVSAVCEVNAQPGFRPHWLADPERDINGEVLETLFGDRPARIPTAAITGTNGKTTTAEMLYHIWLANGSFAGVCTTHVVRIGREIVSTTNLSGHPGARMLLNDPAVEAAVFEMPRLGLLVFGHPCDKYDVAALLNIQDDHLGRRGIDTPEQMAELKAEVIERARNAIVVNADDPLCMAMRSRAGTDRHILVTTSPHGEAVTEHQGQGGEAVFVDNRDGEPWIILATGSREEALLPVNDIPAAMNGLLRFNVSNAMFAAGLAWAQGIQPAVIRAGLNSFHNSTEQNPGRYNMIGGLPFQLLLDYAHNPDGVREVCSVAKQLPVAGRRILCSRSPGNRHAAHFPAFAPSLVDTFDEILLGAVPRSVLGNPDYAGPDPVGAMLSMARRTLLECGATDETITTVTDPDPAQLIRSALELAKPGDLLVVLDSFERTLPVVEEYRRSFS